MVTHPEACVAAIQANVAASVIAGMIADPVTRGANVDACVLIQALLQRHGRSEGVLREAVASFIAADAPLAVSSVLWAHPHDSELCHHVAAALEALMAGLPEKGTPDESVARQESVSVDEPIAALVSVLHVHGKEEVTARKVLAALWAISLKGESPASVLEAMSRAGATEAICAVLGAHFSDIAVSEQGCGLLWLLANSSDDDVLVLAQQSPIRSLVRAMRHHNTNEHVHLQAIGVLTVLALSDPHAKLTIGYEHGLLALCHALEFHPHTGVPAAACAALAALCTLRRFRVGVSRLAMPLLQTLHDRFGCENPPDDHGGDPEQYGPELHTQTLALLHQLAKVKSVEKQVWSRETHKYLPRELRSKIYVVLLCMFGIVPQADNIDQGAQGHGPAELEGLRDLHGAIAMQIEAQFHGVA